MVQGRVLPLLLSWCRDLYPSVESHISKKGGCAASRAALHHYLQQDACAAGPCWSSLHFFQGKLLYSPWSARGWWQEAKG